MKSLYDSNLYMKDVIDVCSLKLPWQNLKDKKILISGSTGMIGSFFIDVILEKNQKENLNCSVYAIGRNKDKALNRFKKHINDSHFIFITHDVNLPLDIDAMDSIDYVFHFASNANPYLYATDPIGTITTNIVGLYNMLELSVKHNSSRFIYASSNEMYGENRGDVELFDEHYCGYIDCNTLRAGYPESKRCGEALCQAYRSQTKIDAVIARFTRTFGPTMSLSDTKAVCQFIKKGVLDEDVILKSAGSQYFSYLYVSDAVSGLLYILFYGNDGEAYNISDLNCDIRLKDLAYMIASNSNKNVVFEQADSIESVGYSKATKARLDGSKLRELGWLPKYDIESGIKRTIEILKYCNN